MLVHQNSVEFLLNPLTWKCQSAASASRTSHLCQSPVAFRPDSDGHCCHDPTNHTSLLGSWSSFPSSCWTWEKKMYNTTSRWIMLPLKLLWKIHTTLYNHLKKKIGNKLIPATAWPVRPFALRVHFPSRVSSALCRWHAPLQPSPQSWESPTPIGVPA